MFTERNVPGWRVMGGAQQAPTKKTSVMIAGRETNIIIMNSSPFDESTYQYWIIAA